MLSNFVVEHAIVIFEHAIMIFKHAIVQMKHEIRNGMLILSPINVLLILPSNRFSKRRRSNFKIKHFMVLLKRV